MAKHDYGGKELITGFLCTGKVSHVLAAREWLVPMAANCTETSGNCHLPGTLQQIQENTQNIGKQSRTSWEYDAGISSVLLMALHQLGIRKPQTIK